MEGRGDWIQTYTGIKFWPLDPRANEVCIEDIAHALSLQCRFAGHCKTFYSVAEHCIRVSRICYGDDSLWGLLHDASEAYLVDIPRPVKHSPEMRHYRVFEKLVQTVICRRFGLPLQEPASVKAADRIILHTEARDLMSPLHPDWLDRGLALPETITPMSPSEARHIFLARFYSLTEGFSESAA